MFFSALCVVDVTSIDRHVAQRTIARRRFFFRRRHLDSRTLSLVSFPLHALFLKAKVIKLIQQKAK
jgi:hypothetical protein